MNLRNDSVPTIQSGSSEDPPTLSEAHVLLVDDQPARLLTYESILEGVGVTCVRALSGEEALKRLLSQEFALILLDVSMPGMDGFETARLIRSHHRFEKTPIIFITGVHVTELDTLRGYEVGGIDYISVPLVPEILRSKVALLVELYRRRAQLERLNEKLEQARTQLQTERDETLANSRLQLEEREARYHAIFEHPTEATVVLEAVRSSAGDISCWRYRDANTTALMLLGFTRETLIGKSLEQIVPERAQKISDRCRAVLWQRSSSRYEDEWSGRRFLVCLFPIGEHTIVSSGVDITARSRAEEERERAMHADRAEKEWLAAVLNSVNEEVYFTDIQGRYSYANPTALREFGDARVAGADVREFIAKLDVHRPDGTPRPVEEAPALRALQGEVIRSEEQVVRIPQSGELRYRQVSSAPVRDASGVIIGSVSIIHDVTDQKRAENALRAREVRSAALLRLGDQFRASTSPGDIAFAATRILGETLGVSRCGYGTIDTAAEIISIEREWNAPGVATLAGILHFRKYGTYIEELKRGQPVVCNDARADARTRDTAAALESIQVRAFVNMPVSEEIGVVALLYLTHHDARVWTNEELSFIREIAERTRVAVERRRSEQALAADLKYSNLLRDLAAQSVLEGNVQVLFDAILDAAIEITAADGGTIQLLDDNTHALKFVAIRRLAPELIRHFEQVDAHSGSSCGIALARGERVMLDFSDIEAEDPDGARRLHRDFGLNCAQSTPLVSRSGRALGMFSTHWRTRHKLSERELRFLDLLARQAADLIDRNQVEQSIRRSEQHLRAAAAEREQLLESEQTARAEAERLSRIKDEFLATLSHELRTPLHAILGWAGLLRSAGGATGHYARGLEVIERNAKAQSKIIDDLLAMSSIVSGRFELETRPVNVVSILHSAVDTVRSSSQAKGIQLRLRLDSVSKAVVRGDAARLQQVFWNLLMNAVKFTPSGGFIDVASSLEGSSIVVSVSDTGAGIRPSFLPYLFEHFRQADSTITRSYGGLGLGLSLVKHLVELHGGTVRARSEGEGRGSTFTVTLPLATVPQLDDTMHPVTSSPDKGATEQPNLSGLVALVVEDDLDARVLLGQHIQSQGGTAILTAGAIEALRTLESRTVDIIVSDIGMPQMDGYQFIERVRSRENPAMREVPAIALTAYAQESDRKRALLAGYQLHLPKPVGRSDLIAAIASLVHVRRSGW